MEKKSTPEMEKRLVSYVFFHVHMHSNHKDKDDVNILKCDEHNVPVNLC